MLIYLTGFMGCGKTTVGAGLASLLSFPFIDLDEQLVEAQGMSIADQFDRLGEQVFRENERNALRQTAIHTSAVIACGGGAPCYFDNMDWMNRHGSTVFLHLSADILASRLLLEKAKRPLLRHFTDEELPVFIEKKLAERMPFYLQASQIIDADRPAEELSAQIFQQLIQHKGS